MRSYSSTPKLFSPPSDEYTARKIFYGVMTAGLFLPPMLLLVYKRFIAPQVNLTTEEFFIIFSAAYVLIFSFISSAAQSASSKLRSKFGKTLPRDAVVLTPAALNSQVPEIVVLGRKYWFWQLAAGYLAGIAFSWLGCIFVLFII